MESNRRAFLKIAGITAAGITVAPVLTRFTASAEDTAQKGGAPSGKTMSGTEALTARHWGMVIDTRQFTSAADLDPLIEACHKVHNVPTFETDLETPFFSADKNRHEIKWLWEDEFKHVFPDAENKYLAQRLAELPFLALCNHCENPPCVRACPTKATFQREDGIVMMDFHRCIGCRFCMAACPYGSRSFNFRDPREGLKETNIAFPTRMKGVVEKCNFCAERLAKGQLPACVEASNGAILFGDLDDPASEVRRALEENFTIRRKPSLGTEPSVYYIV
ncbi:sulfate reduction electron transfer complex DsrMKJOP subunit DsrO [Desulfosudis oleivorans]|uniref:4Fe-4S ferredoxin iron-sulfur binding domain protein n=1 Tax=Desulfosudis oleivorans (strain DSM 6200 / JCM 39069 / Hxd3) TaxID=96561 RepID=A8ZTJ9_DESOH|nr:4Fe-4S dicluster domain-containing protein [Desulfosudis oleivorans]ABW66263.1 4Fe-4S ferredoxin iron-sulfur binding domain protein [Desulfosudis oleivorans Hxd3]